jgi:hypothetical protein
VRRILLLILVVASCTREAAPDDTPPPVDATNEKTTSDKTARPPLVVVGQGSAWCIQMRSLPDRAHAFRVKADIERDLSLSTHVFEALLGDKGTWFRICAGAFDDEATAEASAKEWTAEGGRLRPFMDEVLPGQAAFLIKERPTTGRDVLPPNVSRALESLSGVPVRARIEKRKGGSLYVIDLIDDGHARSTILDDGGQAIALAADADGLGCAPCVAALARHPLARLRVHQTGEIARNDGAELVVTETLADGSEILSVLLTDAVPLVRLAALWLGPSDGARLRALDAHVVDLDGGPTREVALVREDLTVDGERLCALEKRVDVYRIDERAFVRVDVSAHDPAHPIPRVKLVEIEDRLGDVRTASIGCGRAAAHGDAGAIASCQARILALRSQGLLVESVNAAGLLAEASTRVRPLIALGLLDAARALDGAPEKTVVAEDCARAPLVADFTKRLGQGPLLSFSTTGAPPDTTDDGAHEALRDARQKARARVDLGELHDAVFVTARRDFGPESPFGQLAEGWLASIRAVLPARAAAIEALLVAPTGSGSNAAKGKAP